MRCFIAVDLPASIRQALSEQQTAFRAALSGRDAGARWTRPEGIHLTLKFLGEVPEGQVETIKETLAAVGVLEEFPIEVKGFGFFPSAPRPKVFWVGVVAPPALGELAARVETAMQDLGFAREDRAFTPHLTLARFKIPHSQPGLEALVEKRADASLGRFRVSEFFLFESKLSPHGAEYRKLARFPT